MSSLLPITCGRAFWVEQGISREKVENKTYRMSRVHRMLERQVMVFHQNVADGKVAGIEGEHIETLFLLDETGVGHLTVDKLLVKVDGPVKVSISQMH